MEKTPNKKDQTRVLLMTMKSGLLEKLDQHRWPNQMTRSNAIAEALEFYFNHHEAIMEASGRTN